jgi:hypothetical protein
MKKNKKRSKTLDFDRKKRKIYRIIKADGLVLDRAFNKLKMAKFG